MRDLVVCFRLGPGVSLEAGMLCRNRAAPHGAVRVRGRAGEQFFTRKVPVTLFVFGSMTETPPTVGSLPDLRNRDVEQACHRRPLWLFDPVLSIDSGICASLS